MSRSVTLTVAALAMAAGVGVGYWRLTQTANDTAAAPTNTVALGRPEVHKVPGKSKYLKVTDNSLRWEVRVDMLRRIDASQLTGEDIDTLYALLRHDPTAGQEENWWVVVNEIMEQMRRQAIAPERYAKEMLSIIRDPAAPEVLRDYAIQHLGQWVSPRGAKLGQAHEQDPAIVSETAQALVDIITEPSAAHTSIPGTSLMLLIDMKGGGVDDTIMAPALESLTPWLGATVAGTNNTSKITRISAINAIGMLQLEAFRPQVRALAISEIADPSLRLNSIATLGQIGEPSDIATLEAIANTDSRLHYAARSALKKLNANLK